MTVSTVSKIRKSRHIESLCELSGVLLLLVCRMMCTASAASVALEEKMAKFVELLVQDYLKSKGYEETGEKFVEECATRRGARDEGSGSPDKSIPTCATVDEADSWQFLADKLDIPELLRLNATTVTGPRFTSVIEILVKEMVRESESRSRPPSSVSKVKLSDGMRERKLVTERTPTPLSLPRSINTALGKSTDNLSGKESNGPAITDSEETLESRVDKEGASRTELPSRGEAPCLPTANGQGRRTERCEKNILQPTLRRWCGKTGGRREFRNAPQKQHSSKVKRLYDHSLSSKQGGRRAREAGALLSKLQFSKDAIRRQQMSTESWIPDDLRTKMMRRSMRVIKENVYDSVAQGSFARREKKRSSRSELEKVKTQEKFGTKHQRPCALCERYFSAVNLIQTVPFKAIVDLRIVWQKTLPHASGSTAKTSRPMLTPPQCYDEVKVCAFCSQLFHDPVGYRPTWDMQVARMRGKRELLAREEEREYWDPLRTEGEKTSP